MNSERENPVVILGAGAVGSYVGGLLSAAGRAVILVDGWPEHVETIRRAGLSIAGPDEQVESRPEAWHLGEAWRLRRTTPSVAFLTVKLYDTRWAARLLADHLSPDVPVVTMQNGLAEEAVAREVGWARTLGTVAGNLHVSLQGPGTVRRARRRRLDGAPIFETGELHGRLTPRARMVTALLDDVDHARCVGDLWLRRWSKLCINAMSTGLSGLTGLSLREVYAREDTRSLAVALAAEALRVGAALGFERPPLLGLPMDIWVAAAAGEAGALRASFEALRVQADSLEAGGLSGTAQDLAKGRPTEVDHVNGHVAREGKRLGIDTRVNAAVADMIRRAEVGTMPIGPDALLALAPYP